MSELIYQNSWKWENCAFCAVFIMWSSIRLILMCHTALANDGNHADTTTDPDLACFFLNTQYSILSSCSILPRIPLHRRDEYLVKQSFLVQLSYNFIPFPPNLWSMACNVYDLCLTVIFIKIFIMRLTYVLDLQCTCEFDAACWVQIANIYADISERFGQLQCKFVRLS